MRRMLTGAALTVAVVLMLLGRSDATPVTVLVDDALSSAGPAGNNTTLFVPTGSTTAKTGYPGCHNEMLLTNGSSYRVGQAAGFTAGTYDIWTSWYVSNGVSNAVTATVINGTAVGPINTTINTTKDAGQGVAGTLASTSSLSGNGSGYYYLGRYALTTSSTVNFSGSGWIIGDSVLLRNADAGFLLDPRTAKSTNVSLWSANGGVFDGKYAYSLDDFTDPSITYAATNRWCGGSSGTGYVGPINLSYAVGAPLALHDNGLFFSGMKLQISWAAGKSTAVAPNNAKYLVDLDGNLATTGDQYTFNVNEQLMADGSTPGTSSANGAFEWSGWYTLTNPDNVNGLWRLTSSSVVYLTDRGLADAGSGISALTAASVLVTPMTVSSSVPEPATLLLLGTGALGAIGCIRRWRIR